MTETESYPVWVCVDCYFSHHYGARAVNGEWFAGDSDTPTDREPLTLLETASYVGDWTDAESGEGIDSFSWRQCEGCGSTLGGERYRLSAEYAVTV